MSIELSSTITTTSTHESSHLQHAAGWRRYVGSKGAILIVVFMLIYCFAGVETWIPFHSRGAIVQVSTQEKKEGANNTASMFTRSVINDSDNGRTKYNNSSSSSAFVHSVEASPIISQSQQHLRGQLNRTTGDAATLGGTSPQRKSSLVGKITVEANFASGETGSNFLQRNITPATAVDVFIKHDAIEAEIIVGTKTDVKDNSASIEKDVVEATTLSVDDQTFVVEGGKVVVDSETLGQTTAIFQTMVVLLIHQLASHSASRYPPINLAWATSYRKSHLF